jgi:surface-anchored protein
MQCPPLRSLLVSPFRRPGRPPRRRGPQLRVVELEDRTNPALIYLPNVVATGHADLAFSYAGSAWQAGIATSVGGAGSALDTTLLFAGRPSKTTVTDPQLAFLGANAAGDVWTFPQAENPALPVPSVGVSASGNFTSYVETDPRVVAQYGPAGRPWVKVSLNQVVTAPAGGSVSVWSAGVGGPVPWITSADGVQATDALWVPAGTHPHFNWSFTAKGVYEVKLDVSARVGGVTQTTTKTVYFATDTYDLNLPPVNDVPASITMPRDTSWEFGWRNDTLLQVNEPNGYLPRGKLRVALAATHGNLRIDSEYYETFIVAGANNSPAFTLEGSWGSLGQALQRLYYTPAAGYVGAAAVTFSSNDLGYFYPDNYGLTGPGEPGQPDPDAFADNHRVTTSVIAVTVTANTAPVITGLPQGGVLGQTVYFPEDTASPVLPFTIRDAETPVGSLTVTLESPEPRVRVVMTGTGEARTIQIVPDPDFAGGSLVRVTVSDGQFTTSQYFNYHVQNVNDPPVIVGPTPFPDLVMDEDEVYNFYDFEFYDIDGGFNAFFVSTNQALFPNSSAEPDPEGTQHEAIELGWVEYGQPPITFRPAKDQSGTAAITLWVMDYYGALSDSVTFTVTVRPVYDPPEPLADSILAVPGRTSTYDVRQNDLLGPEEGQFLQLVSYSPLSRPGSGTLVPGDRPGVFRFTPAAGFVSTDARASPDWFTYTVADMRGNLFTRTAFIYVAEKYDAVLGNGASANFVSAGYAGGEWSVYLRTWMRFGDDPLPPPTMITRPPMYLDLDETNFVVIATEHGGSGTVRENYVYHPFIDPLPTSFGVAPGAMYWSEGSITTFRFSAADVTPGTFVAGPGESVPTVRFELVGATTPAGAAATYYRREGRAFTGYWTTADGIGAGDVYAVPAGAEVVTGESWAFSAPGQYALQFRVKSYVLNAQGQRVEVVSPVNTIRFFVDPTGATPTPPETAPQARDDVAVVNGDVGATTIPVVGNDSASPDALEVIAVTGVGPAGHGTVAVGADGKSVVYTPAPDYAGPDSFTYTITDEHGGTATATVTVVVTINLAPTLTLPATHATAEDTPAGVPLTVGDPETPAADLVVTATSSDQTLLPDANVVVTGSGATRTLTLTPAPGRFGTVTVTVTVRDGGGRATVRQLVLTVTSVNDSPALVGGSFAVPESAAPGTTVGTATGSDPDPDAPNNTLTYAIVGGNVGGVFAVDAAGVITVAPGAALDFEARSAYSLTVEVRDGGGLTATAVVTVTVGDVNEAPVLADTVFGVDENTAAGAVVGTLAAADPDTTAPNNQRTYAVTGGTGVGVFTVSPGGVVTVVDPAALDFETATTFTLIVQVSDGGGLSDAATVTLSVRDVNEAPEIGSASFGLSENAPAGTVVGTVAGTDPDATAPNNTLTYTITAGNTGGAFAVGPGGVVTVAHPAALDFEAAPAFTLTVRVEDGGGLSATATVTVTLTDVNEPPADDDAAAFVAENAVAGTVVGTVSASDPDGAAPNNALAFTITGGDPGGVFAVDGLGRVTVANPAALDFETAGTFVLEIRVVDGGGLSDTATVTVTLTDVNEAPALAGASFTVPENSPAGAAVGTVPGSDPDGTAPDNALTYTITAGNAGGAFAVGPGGVVTVAHPAALDFEATPTFTLTVRVEDGGGLSATATVTVTLTDVNEAPNAVDDDLTTTGAATAVPVLANDSDPDADALSVSAVTQPAHGTVTLAGGAVVYTPATGYVGADSFTYTAADGRGGTATATVRVTVLPVPPPPPPPPQRRLPGFAVGAGSGGGVRVFAADMAERGRTVPFPGFTGAVRTATADFNGDGVADLAAATGPGVPAEVVVLDGASGAELFRTRPFADFTGGAFVAVGDMTRDGRPELVVTPDEGGGPRVVAFRGGDFAPLVSFFAIDDPAFRGGARAALGDVSGDGVADLIVSAGFGGGPRVALWDGAGLGRLEFRKLAHDFFLFEAGLRNGAYVAVGDVDGDGYGDVIGGGGPGGGPRVYALSGWDLMADRERAVANFYAGDVDTRGGVRVAATDLDGDGRADVVTGAGAGAGAGVAAYRGADLAAGPAPPARTFDAFPGLTDGVYVG